MLLQPHPAHMDFLIEYTILQIGEVGITRKHEPYQNKCPLPFTGSIFVLTKLHSCFKVYKSLYRFFSKRLLVNMFSHT